MTATPVEAGGWSGRRFWLNVLAVGVLHVLVLASVGGRPAEVRVAGPAGFSLRWLDWDTTPDRVAMRLGVSDPSLFATPGARSLGSVAWRRTGHPVGASVGWNEAPLWLEVSTNWFRELPAFDRESGAELRAVDARPLPEVSEVEVAPVPMAARSEMELDAALAARGLRESAIVPSINHTNLLDNPVRLEITVDADGLVFSAIVFSSSGWRPADDRALKLVKGLRFKPLEGAGSRPSSAERQWGQVRVRWHSVNGGAPPAASPTPP